MLSAAIGDRVELAFAATGEPRVADAVTGAARSRGASGDRGLVPVGRRAVSGAAARLGRRRRGRPPGSPSRRGAADREPLPAGAAVAHRGLGGDLDETVIGDDVCGTPVARRPRRPGIRPSSRAKACFLIGVCTHARPARSPTMPRDITAAPENGSTLPTACSDPSSRRNSATWVPSGISTPTPRHGINLPYSHAVVHTATSLRSSINVMRTPVRGRFWAYRWTRLRNLATGPLLELDRGIRRRRAR